MKNKTEFETRLSELISDIEKISKYPDFTPSGRINFYKNEDIKILRQTFAKFIAKYELLNSELYYSLKYQIEQL